ncbi:hypothetical protein J4456_01685 [Candidatus Pacearchaeota archaeon]|nr:hypothetical protein [Candidatus Pacearchaeota archaeon]
MFDNNKRLFEGKILGNKKRIIYSDLGVQPNKTHFSGASPPEVFVGRFNYPHVNAGILSPEVYEGTEAMSYPEVWYEKKFSIYDILSRRGQLIYGKFKVNTKKTYSGKFLNIMQELSLAYKSVSTEFFLKKPPAKSLEISRFSPIIANPAPLDHARLQENPKVKPKVDYIVSDTQVKAADAIRELYKSQIAISNINKILSTGLLGQQTRRRLVPTRWSITAVDDTISKNFLENIRHYEEINEILLFNEEYNGNHYEILLLPGNFSFEVIEAEIKFGEIKFWQDFELFHGRKYYANNVVGAYYANRVAVCEYLEKIKKQATAIFFREVRPDYYAPLGVGILRECTRDAFRKTPERFATIDQALQQAQIRLKLPIKVFREKSILLKEYGKQKKLTQWFYKRNFY